MAKKRSGGFRAPKDYEPNRGRSASKFSTRGQSPKAGSQRGGRDEFDVEQRPRQQRGNAAQASRHSGARTKGNGADEFRADAGSAHRRSPRDSASSNARGYERRTDNARSRAESVRAREGQERARVFTFDGDGKSRGDSARHSNPRPVALDTVIDKIEGTHVVSAGASKRTFAELGLGNNIVRALAELGAERPFPIQAATIPDILAGKDVLGRGRTGSGKTIAFGAALVERLLILKAAGAFESDPPREREKLKRGERRGRAPARQQRKPKALILAPTRELALQLDATVQPIARAVGLYTAQLVGGVPVEPQLHALERGIDIVIGTPGRIQDLVDRRKLDLREVRVSVVDEADHMCDLGFLDPVQKILRLTEREGQRLLFSATLDQAVSQLVREFLREPAVYEVADSDSAAAAIEHRVFVVLREHKDEVLTQLLRKKGRVMVFCRTRAYADQLVEMLDGEGVAAIALHGDLSQARRERNLAKFAQGGARVLVATDVAARGIHVDDVDLVVQADPPGDYKGYLHRSGRTGRAGKTGRVVTIVPRTMQKRTREMLENAEVKVAYFGDFAPGDNPLVTAK